MELCNGELSILKQKTEQEAYRAIEKLYTMHGHS